MRAHNKLWHAINIATVSAFVLVASMLLPTFDVSADTSLASTYLSGHAQDPWVTMALVAAGNSVDVSYLATFTGSTATDYEKAIMALTVAGKDPSTYGSEDLIVQLRTFHTSGQVGDASLLNDDIFSIPALVSAGISTSDQMIVDAKNTILTNQNSDGGWGWSTSTTSDVDDTSAAIIALIESDVSASDSVIIDAKAYLKAAQNEDGGFPYDPNSSWGTDSNSSSDAWAISAINAMGDTVASWTKSGGDPLSNMLTLQDATGYFHYSDPTDSANSFTPITTAYAVIAESGKWFPVAKISATQEEAQHPVNYRIQGSAGTICEGGILAHDAMDVVLNSASICNFTYNVTETSFGPYLDAIGADVAGGVTGWQYMVEFTPPSVGAGDYELSDGDDVLWYYGNWDAKIMRITLSETSISSTDILTITVHELVSGEWRPLADADVHIGSNDFVSDSAGIVSTNLSDGAYNIYASKDGHINSETETVSVGTVTESSVSLTTNITGNTGNSDSDPTQDVIAISLDAQVVDFGDLKKGDDGDRSLKITNTGTVRIHVEGNVTGDDLFRNYLKIAADIWRNFVRVLDVNESETLNLKLQVPSDYSSTGQKNGTLLFWAIKTI